ncbi:MAG: type IV conjugative transfer system protein TraL [Anaerohalosphaeraceae bacterium]|nr:type IV conjugative transfer system protein TraL [Anaerohalosphaeraceae bacterium]
MENNDNFFPQHLASPMQVLWFDSDDLAIALLFFMLASVFGGWAWILFLLGPYLYLRIKMNYPKSFLKHFLYFSGLKTPRNLPSAFEKRFGE